MKNKRFAKVGYIGVSKFYYMIASMQIFENPTEKFLLVILGLFITYAS